VIYPELDHLLAIASRVLGLEVDVLLEDVSLTVELGDGLHC
jgi:hypothetical protein